MDLPPPPPEVIEDTSAVGTISHMPPPPAEVHSPGRRSHASVSPQQPPPAVTVSAVEDEALLPTATVRPILAEEARILHNRGPLQNSSDVPDELELRKVESFYRSRSAQVSVCRCMANLYLNRGLVSARRWELQFTGVPLLLLFEQRSRSGPRLALILAERGTGFTLWQEQVSATTAYSVDSGTFHVLEELGAPGGTPVTAGLSFDSQTAAEDFHRSFKNMFKPLKDFVMEGGKKRRKRGLSATGASPKFRVPRKQDISKPCCFTHITNLQPEDSGRILTMSLLAPPVPVRSVRSESFLSARAPSPTSGERSDCKPEISMYQSQQLLASLKL